MTFFFPQTHLLTIMLQRRFSMKLNLGKNPFPDKTSPVRLVVCRRMEI